MRDDQDRETRDEQRTQPRGRWFRPGDWPIWVKTLVSVVAVVTLALSITGLINARTLQTRLRERIGAEFETLADSEASGIGEILSKQIIILQGIALNDLVKADAETSSMSYQGDLPAIEAELLVIDDQWRAAADDSALVQSIVDPASNRLTAQLLDFAMAFPDHVELFLTDRYGGLLASTGRTSDYYQADEAWWQAAYNDGKGGYYLSQPEYDESAGYTSIVMAGPIVSDQSGKVVGIARTTFRMDAVYQAVSKLQFGATGQTIVIDSSGLVIASSIPERVGTQASPSWHSQEIAQSRTGSLELLDETGVQLLAGYAALTGAGGEQDTAAAIQSLGWTLFATQSQAEAYAPVRSATQTTLVSTVAFTLVAAILAFALARMVVAPISHLVESARRMAIGDLNARAPVSRQDETGELAWAFNRMADEIAEVVGSLQQRVEERTQELERRAASLEATAEVAQNAASVLDVQELLSLVTALISERFGFYHVGVFMLDEAGEYAILRAANSAGGQRMLSRGHRLRVGETGLVGYVTGRGQPRIALDVADERLRGADAIHFDNPDLPETRSEIALPLRARGEILGALDVQSVEPGAFGREDVALLQTLADQVALAISNAQLFQQVQASLEAELRAYGQLGRGAWEELLRARSGISYRYRQGHVVSLDGDAHAGQRAEGRSDDSQDLAALEIPVQVRGHVIGTIRAQKPEGAGEWSGEDLTLMETMAESFGQALESARLYQDTQDRAAREQLLGEVVARMRESLDVETVLKTTASEVRQALDLDSLVIRLATPETGGDSKPARERT
jgi:GAF domain-containing protein/HAMP domain-containing protein